MELLFIGFGLGVGAGVGLGITLAVFTPLFKFDVRSGQQQEVRVEK